jgi:hypothetical protein
MDVWTVPQDGGWANIRAGSVKVSNRGRRKADVLRIGRAMARIDGVEHVILKETGQIQRRTTYRPDLEAPVVPAQRESSDRPTSTVRVRPVTVTAMTR